MELDTMDTPWDNIYSADVSEKGGRVKQSALPLVVILIFAVVVAFSVLRFHWASHVYVPPKKLPEMRMSPGVDVDKPMQVLVALHVGKDGKVLEDSLVQSSGDPLVDADALKMALHFKFEPATMGKRQVDTWISLPIEYHPAPDTLPAE
jgi:TonB family protein